MKTQREVWEYTAKRLPAHLADALEENARDLGLEEESEAFWTECVDQSYDYLTDSIMKKTS